MGIIEGLAAKNAMQEKAALYDKMQAQKEAEYMAARYANLGANAGYAKDIEDAKQVMYADAAPVVNEELEYAVRMQPVPIAPVPQPNGQAYSGGLAERLIDPREYNAPTGVDAAKAYIQKMRAPIKPVN